MDWLWPIRTGRTLFDVWTIAHLAFWVFVASTMAAFKMPMFKAGCIVVAVAGLWELFERFAEAHWPKIWAHPESWYNALISDIGIAGLLGLVIGYWIYRNQ